MKLRNRVRQRRVERGMFKSELARRASISRSTLDAIEVDDGYEPLASNMTALVVALDDPLLFWWERSEQAASLTPRAVGA